VCAGSPKHAAPDVHCVKFTTPRSALCVLTHDQMPAYKLALQSFYVQYILHMRIKFDRVPSFLTADRRVDGNGTDLGGPRDICPPSVPLTSQPTTTIVTTCRNICHRWLTIHLSPQENSRYISHDSPSIFIVGQNSYRGCRARLS
jgi:hypothetical protein